MQNNLEADIVHAELENQYHVCCSQRTTDRRILKFGSQVGVSLLVFIICFIQICVRGVTGDQLTVYISLMSGITGYFLPSPQLK